MIGPGCLMCRVDERVKDPDVRAFTYMAIAGMAEQVHKTPWQEYTDCCRRHAMLSVKATCELGELMISLLDESTPRGLEPIAERAKEKTRKLLAELELAVMDKYDRKEEGSKS